MSNVWRGRKGPRRSRGLPANRLLARETPHMAFLNFKKKHDGRLVVLTYEGPGRLLLNGNRTHDERARRNAAAHPGTVCWIELASSGGRMAQGVGPAAIRL